MFQGFSSRLGDGQVLCGHPYFPEDPFGGRERHSARAVHRRSSSGLQEAVDEVVLLEPP